MNLYLSERLHYIKVINSIVWNNTQIFGYTKIGTIHQIMNYRWNRSEMHANKILFIEIDIEEIAEFQTDSNKRKFKYAFKMDLRKSKDWIFSGIYFRLDVLTYVVYFLY